MEELGRRLKNSKAQFTVTKHKTASYQNTLSSPLTQHLFLTHNNANMSKNMVPLTLANHRHTPEQLKESNVLAEKTPHRTHQILAASNPQSIYSHQRNSLLRKSKNSFPGHQNGGAEKSSKVTSGKKNVAFQQASNLQDSLMLASEPTPTNDPVGSSLKNSIKKAALNSSSFEQSKPTANHIQILNQFYQNTSLQTKQPLSTSTEKKFLLPTNGSSLERTPGSRLTESNFPPLATEPGNNFINHGKYLDQKHLMTKIQGISTFADSILKHGQSLPEDQSGSPLKMFFSPQSRSKKPNIEMSLSNSLQNKTEDRMADQRAGRMRGPSTLETNEMQSKMRQTKGPFQATLFGGQGIEPVHFVGQDQKSLMNSQGRKTQAMGNSNSFNLPDLNETKTQKQLKQLESKQNLSLEGHGHQSLTASKAYKAGGQIPLSTINALRNGVQQNLQSLQKQRQQLEEQKQQVQKKLQGDFISVNRIKGMTKQQQLAEARHQKQREDESIENLTKGDKFFSTRISTTNATSHLATPLSIRKPGDTTEGTGMKTQSAVSEPTQTAEQNQIFKSSKVESSNQLAILHKDQGNLLIVPDEEEEDEGEPEGADAPIDPELANQVEIDLQSDHQEEANMDVPCQGQNVESQENLSIVDQDGGAVLKLMSFNTSSFQTPAHIKALSPPPAGAIPPSSIHTIKRGEDDEVRIQDHSAAATRTYPESLEAFSQLRPVAASPDVGPKISFEKFNDAQQKTHDPISLRQSMNDLKKNLTAVISEDKSRVQPMNDIRPSGTSDPAVRTSSKVGRSTRLSHPRVSTLQKSQIENIQIQKLRDEQVHKMNLEKWQQQAKKDQLTVEAEYAKPDQAKQPFCASECDAFRLHKFWEASSSANQPTEAYEGTSPMKASESKLASTPMERLFGSPIKDQYFSTYIPGLVKYIKYQLHQQPSVKAIPPSEKIQKCLGTNNSKRGEVKRTLIGIQRQDTFGYRLERKQEFQLPKVVSGNNFYKGHSRISKKIIKRKFKGPLYNEAGRVCIELTDKYICLENLRLNTIISDLDYKYQIAFAQAEKLKAIREIEEQLAAQQQQQTPMAKNKTSRAQLPKTTPSRRFEESKQMKPKPETNPDFQNYINQTYHETQRLVRPQVHIVGDTVVQLPQFDVEPSSFKQRGTMMNPPQTFLPLDRPMQNTMTFHNPPRQAHTFLRVRREEMSNTFLNMNRSQIPRNKYPINPPRLSQMHSIKAGGSLSRNYNQQSNFTFENKRSSALGHR